VTRMVLPLEVELGPGDEQAETEQWQRQDHRHPQDDPDAWRPLGGGCLDHSGDDRPRRPEWEWRIHATETFEPPPVG
jgi:hypothetical protein